MATSLRRVDLRLLDHRFVWRTRNPLTARLIESTYARFLYSRALGRSPDPDPMENTPGEDERPEDESPQLALHALAEKIYRRIETHLLLHAGAVERKGRAIVLGGPSSFGKTTLTLRLVAEGFRFLGDEIAPIERSTGRIEPLPRAIGLRPGAGDGIEPMARDALRRGRAIEVGGKVVVDIEDLFPDSIGQAADTGAIVVFGTSDETSGRFGDGFHRVEIALREAEGRLLSDLRALPGVIIEGQLDREVPTWRLRLDGRAGGSAALEGLRERWREEILWVVPVLSHSGWSAPPVLRPLERSRAAFALVRDLLNRQPGGHLLGTLGGKLEVLTLELAGRLRSFDCWLLRPGPIEETVGLLRSLV